ncbi:MAG: methyltransferase domain-containing protein [Chitinophagaceae bacterium]|nr:methyltransferase domain-containing protein [Chitinophagaceae bacterium]
MSKALFVILLLLSFFSQAQQKPRRGLAFCGWKYSDTAVIRRGFERQLAFLQIHDGDTIVDIGSSSGAVEGCLGVISNFQNVHVVLVDIDSGCLNRERVDNMLNYYAGVKGRPLGLDLSIVNNTVDSLYLPLNQYQHVWMMNTLHEIPDKDKMIRSMHAVLRKGGELILSEMLARPKHVIHGGCRQPLMTEQEIQAMFERNGFKQADALMNANNVTKGPNPFYMVRFIKQ